MSYVESDWCDLELCEAAGPVQHDLFDILDGTTGRTYEHA